MSFRDIVGGVDKRGGGSHIPIACGADQDDRHSRPGGAVHRTIEDEDA